MEIHSDMLKRDLTNRGTRQRGTEKKKTTKQNQWMETKEDVITVFFLFLLRYL